MTGAVQHRRRGRLTLTPEQLQAWHNLSDHEKQVVSLRRQGLNGSQIGAKLGYSRQRAHSILKRALGKLG